MYEISIGDFRNFCLDSCCKDKYKFRLNPNPDNNYGPQWLVEGFIITDTEKYILVFKNFKTEFYKNITWDGRLGPSFKNTIEEVKKMIGDMVGK
jgi:hypothetical protein